MLSSQRTGALFLFTSPKLHSHGDERIRTADPLRARQVFSQLNYAPACRRPLGASPSRQRARQTTALLWAYLDLNQGPHAYQACALNHLSYRPAE